MLSAWSDIFDDVMLCYVMLCYVMLCYVMLCSCSVQNVSQPVGGLSMKLSETVVV